MRPVDGVTLDEAAHIIGCSMQSVRTYIARGDLPALGGRYQHRRVSRADAEAFALQRRSCLVALPGEVSYWCDAKEAAAILGVHRSRIGQLVESGGIPYETHSTGKRLFRREQLETVANARRERWPR